jgi:hypothetical protein
VLERRLCRLRSAAARQVPAQQLSAAIVDYQRQRRPAITSSPNPAQISVAQRSFGRSASDNKALIRGLKPPGRFLTLQPLLWKIRCTVFLLQSSRCANVRVPNDEFYSILALIGDSCCS